MARIGLAANVVCHIPGQKGNKKKKNGGAFLF